MKKIKLNLFFLLLSISSFAQNITIENAGSENINGEYTFDGNLNGRPVFVKGEGFDMVYVEYRCNLGYGCGWHISAGFDTYYFSNEFVQSPELVKIWTVKGSGVLPPPNIKQSINECAKKENVYSFTYKNNLYEIIKEKRDWFSANNCAIERNGQLVDISSLDEQFEIFNNILQSGIELDYVNVPDGGGVAYVWIGASDDKLEGDWKWVSKGTNFWKGNNNSIVNINQYHNWGGKEKGVLNEPDNFNGKQNFAAIALTSWPNFSIEKLGNAGEWNDLEGVNKLYYVIKKDLPVNVFSTERNKVNELKIYPNPFQNEFYFNNEITGEYRIYDINSKLIMNGNISNQHKIQTNFLPIGLYFLEIISDNGFQIVKIIKE